jgi:hypothetical protein
MTSLRQIVCSFALVGALTATAITAIPAKANADEPTEAELMRGFKGKIAVSDA